jgi:dihydropteroate synthase
VTEAPLFARGGVTIVGVLNVTPDSFSDGGRFVRAGGTVDVGAAVAEGLALAAAGADVLDVGGESTRPGARAVGADEELARVIPVLEALAKASPVPLAIDTRKAEVAEAALAAGAAAVNDVSGLGFDPALAGVVARSGATLVLGHLRGEPATMQDDPRFDDVLEEVARELAASVARARAAGVERERLVVDPGIGFGKRLEDNLVLLANLGELRRRLGLPVLVGASRKSFLGRLTGEPPARRDGASHAAAAVAVFAGADAVRVHDVAGARSAVAVGLALRRARREAGA